MIKSLTKNQVENFSFYVEKWLKIGLSTEQVSFDETKKVVNNFYKHILSKTNPIIIITDSPLSVWYATIFINVVFDNKNITDQVRTQVNNQVDNQVIDQVNNQVGAQVWDQVWNQVNNRVWNQVWDQVDNQVRNQVEDQVEDQVRNQVRDQVDNQVRAQVWDQVWNQVWDQVDSQVEDQVWDQVGAQVKNQVWNQVNNQVWNQVRDQVWNQVRDQVDNQVRAQVWNQVWDQVDNQVRNQVWDQVDNQVNNQVWDQVWNQVWEQVNDRIKNYVYPYTDNNFMSGYFSFYDYMQNELGIHLSDNFEIYKQTSKLGLMYCLSNFCIVSKKPSVINIKDGQLHNENGPSIIYKDFEVYTLNGVKVSKEIVMTPWNKLDSTMILKEKNAEVRREIVRKIGIEKICKDLNAKVIDKKYDYELLLLDLNDNNHRTYLKMKNPSIGVYHIEGVNTNCKTVEDALISRKPEEMRKIPISKNGEDWYQQGDVCIWNKDAKSLKLYPKILT